MSVDFVGIGEASEILGLSRTSIQKLVDSGQLAAVKTTGGHRRILLSAVEEINQRMGPKAMLRLAASAALDAHNSSASQTEIQVLLVEDDGPTAAVITGVFERFYPEVKCLVATDGLDAVLQLERTRPKILITDLSMQPFDGFRLLQMVSGRPEYQGVALVVISGMSDSQIAERGGLPSSAVFLRKPISIDRLRGFIDAHVQLLKQKTTA